MLPLQRPEKACRDVADFRGEARGREMETEHYAHRGLPYSQARVFAQCDYRQTTSATDMFTVK
jgi:hypothetical protein